MKRERNNGSNEWKKETTKCGVEIRLFNPIYLHYTNRRIRKLEVGLLIYIHQYQDKPGEGAIRTGLGDFYGASLFRIPWGLWIDPAYPARPNQY